MTTQTNKQAQIWSGDFGREYTNRNHMTLAETEGLYERNFGIRRTALNHLMLGDLDRTTSILEVGANVGNQLRCLQNMGFVNLQGIELQPYAVELANRHYPDLNIRQGSAFDLPFPEDSFDLVFTSGVLIHIHPEKLPAVLAEIYRCSRTYIWGCEYYAPESTEVVYRGQTSLLWKMDYCRQYQEHFPDLGQVRQVLLPHRNSSLVDTMFLLAKPGHQE